VDDILFLKAREFRKILGISSATFYRRMKTNKYPFNCHIRFEPTGHIYFPRSLLTDLTTKALNGNVKADGGTE